VVSAPQRDTALLAALREGPAGPGIVYVTRQKTAEDIAARLVEAGWSARAYHAGMNADERSAVQEWFLGSQDALVVATIAFGMGVDKADIRRVIHYNPPKSLENYAQEIGRAGRDGQRSDCLLLFCPDDLNPLENFIYGDTPERSALAGLIGQLFTLGEQFDIALGTLSDRHDIRPLVLRTLMTYLQLDGYLLEGTPYYADYRFQPRTDSARILDRFDGERRQFLARLFAQSYRARTWFCIDLAASARALRCDRERIVKALDWLAEQQLLELKVAGLQHRYRRLRRPEDESVLVDALHQRMQQREAAELGRLQQVVSMLVSSTCRSRALAAHFGETLAADCGHCSACLDQSCELPERSPVDLPATLSAELSELVKAHADIFASARQLTRFLCGCSSPVFTRCKLSRDPNFGRLVEVPFADVLSWAQSFRGSQAGQLPSVRAQSAGS
jgi:ATP-dependent DNA helicase RecQ